LFESAHKQLWSGIALLLSLVGWYWMAYEVERHHFTELIVIFAGLFLTYWFIVKAGTDQQVKWWGLAGAIGFRLLYLPAMPELSDDVYRFIWDGRLLVQGIDPFKHLPVYYITGAGRSLDLAGISESFFQKLNSPEYYTVYPPLSQGVFALAAWLFPNSVTGSVVVIRGVLLIADLANLYLLHWLLRYFRLPGYLLLLYALNPLVIAELTGNLHFEGLMLFGLLLAWVLLCRQRYWWSACAFSIGVLTKLLPLMLLPLLIRRIGWVHTLIYSAMVGVLTFCGFLAVTEFGQLYHMLDSVELYFQTFEFNAGPYYLLRWVGFQLEGYNMIGTIGKILPVLSVSGIAIYAWREKRPDQRHLPQAVLAVWTFYLLLSTTIHPWYIAALLPFALFTRFRFPFLWSFLALLSYATYRVHPYQEIYWLTAMEYLLVGILLVLEWRQKNGSRFLLFRR